MLENIPLELFLKIFIIFTAIIANIVGIAVLVSLKKESKFYKNLIETISNKIEVLETNKTKKQNGRTRSTIGDSQRESRD